MSQINRTFANKTIKSVPYLQSQMQAAQWPGAVVASCESAPPSCVTVTDSLQPDPTAFVAAYVDPAVITATSNKPVGASGFPQGLANGVDTQTISIQLKDPYTGGDVGGTPTILAYPQSPLVVSSTSVALVNGAGTFTAGPTTTPGLYTISLKYSTDMTNYSYITIKIAFF